MTSVCLSATNVCIVTMIFGILGTSAGQDNTTKYTIVTLCHDHSNDRAGTEHYGRDSVIAVVISDIL